MVNFLAGLALGFLGSAHCVGMCGPLALSIPLPNGKNKYLYTGFYQIGRTLAYVSLGVVVAYLGQGVKFFVAQQIFSILIGSLMLLFLFRQYVLNKHIRFKMPYAGAVQKAIAQLLNKPNNLHNYAFLGFLNGLLPCGLVYVALGGAAILGSIYSASFMMIGFGLGTVPAMAFMMLFKQKLTSNIRFKKWIPVLVGITAILMIVRGLNLGIPYLSPKLNLSKGKIEKCCPPK